MNKEDEIKVIKSLSNLQLEAIASFLEHADAYEHDCSEEPLSVRAAVKLIRDLKHNEAPTKPGYFRYEDSIVEVGCLHTSGKLCGKLYVWNAFSKNGLGLVEEMDGIWGEEILGLYKED